MVELNRMGLGADHVKPEELLELRGAPEVDEHLKTIADELLEAREKEVGPEAWATIERFVLLRTIDSLWVEHLTEVDDMRRGIGLRGYAQQDPLNEFRKEAFRLYEELSGFIRHQVASTIFRVNVQTQPHVHTPGGVFPLPGPGQAGRGGAPVAAGGRSGGAPARQGIRATAGPGVSGTAGVASATGAAGAAAGGFGAGQQARPGHTPSGAKIGRNDACWCGSGLKYKKCHGR